MSNGGPKETEKGYRKQRRGKFGCEEEGFGGRYTLGIKKFGGGVTMKRHGKVQSLGELSGKEGNRLKKWKTVTADQDTFCNGQK